ncbi:IDLSRF-like peptide like protein [Argiope bruennichi]|uniref:IDLSRF-like peptide like protein n=1 Tax=Argiope bruennichi TaxID=94029 RepID=A0A8T0F1D1_ARGBR|nr:IDLSRF-like peptide like protein [Argiope bruennichi]
MPDIQQECHIFILRKQQHFGWGKQSTSSAGPSLAWGSRAYSYFSRVFHHNLANVKREADTDRCHPTQPFRCPGERTVCISIQYLCDGASDCEDGYDEDPRLCTAAKRPPVEETANFLHTLIMNHGPNYLEKLFGSKARDALEPLGGMQKVAIALSESETLEDFGKALHLMRSDLEHLRNVFMAVETGDFSLLKSLGIRDSELGDVKFFLDKLVSTGFMD